MVWYQRFVVVAVVAMVTLSTMRSLSDLPLCVHRARSSRWYRIRLSLRTFDVLLSTLSDSCSQKIYVMKHSVLIEVQLDRLFTSTTQVPHVYIDWYVRIQPDPYRIRHPTSVLGYCPYLHFRKGPCALPSPSDGYGMRQLAIVLRTWSHHVTG
jgi:hypothetical protein